MTLPTELTTIFQNKQASYKMVLILSLLESIDNKGIASINKVVVNFLQYYIDRQDNGKIIEKEGKVITKLDSLSTSRTRSLILGDPYNSLSSILTKEGTSPDEYIRFKPEIWAQLDESTIRELRIYALDELEKYYVSLSTSVQPEKGLERMIVGEPIVQTIDHIKQYIARKGFSFPDRLIENFYLSIKTKPFTILAGISGTGKTKLIQLFAEAIGAHLNDQYTLIPVRPDWSEPSDLLGYVDLQGEFRAGPLTKVIIEASKPENLNKPYLVCLDEMNLARVEHYFSDFLSIMETRKWHDTEQDERSIRTNSLLKLDHLSLKEWDLHIPDNIYLIGTVNMDETTYPFSKKVLDRANTIEFNEVNLENYPEVMQATDQVKADIGLPAYANDFLRSDYITLQDAYTEDDQEYIHKVVQQLTKLNRILEQAHLHIGFRVRDELTFYMLYNRRFQLMNEYEAFDFQVMQKILPRIQGSSFMMKKILIDLYNQLANTNLSEKEDDLHIEMINHISENSKYKRSLSKIAYMVRRYEEDGFTSFWIA
jgi:5-methylcytosine-specific restriction protein B